MADDWHQNLLFILLQINTSILIEHDERSVNIAAPKQKIIERFETFLNCSLSDKG